MKNENPFDIPYIKSLRKWSKDQIALVAAERVKPVKPIYKLLGTFKSGSSKAIYKVYKRPYGITCNCPGFVFRKQCKHIKAFV